MAKDFIDSVMSATDTSEQLSEQNNQQQQPQDQQQDQQQDNAAQLPDDSGVIVETVETDKDKSQQQRPTGPEVKPQGQQPNAQQQRTNGQQTNNPTQGMKRVGSNFADAKGNIVDKGGKIVAPAGAAARWWQEASRATAQVQNLTRQLTAATETQRRNEAVIAQAREIADLPKKYNMSREDFNEGVRLIASWQADPVGMTKQLVARTLARGHNLSEILGKSAGDAVEMTALTQLINTALKPQQEQQQRQQREAELNDAAERDYQAFITRYPDAPVHGAAIAALVNKTNVSPEVAYHQLKVFAIENGLDFSQPLAEQVSQRRTQPQLQQQQPQIAPMANGSHTASSANGARGSQQPTNDAFSPTDTWADILTTEMRRTN